MRHTSFRRATAALALALVLIGPLPVTARAQAPGGPVESQSVAGALFAIACGASARVATTFPEPIVVTVTAVICGFAVLDAWLSSDGPY